MTCIVGIIEEETGRVIIGADSAGISGYDKTIRADSKVFVNGPMIFGCTTSWRMIQLLRYSLTIPTQDEGQEDFAFLVTKFIPAVRECLAAGGFRKKENEVESGGQFLIGYHGNLYQIHDDFQVSRNAGDFACCGCGESYATGALAAMSLEDGNLSESHLLKALSIAAEYSAGVAPPFITVMLPRTTSSRDLHDGLGFAIGGDIIKSHQDKNGVTVVDEFCFRDVSIVEHPPNPDCRFDEPLAEWILKRNRPQ